MLLDAVNFSTLCLHGPNQPGEEGWCDAGIQLSTPFGIGEDLSEPRWYVGEPFDDCIPLLHCRLALQEVQASCRRRRCCDCEAAIHECRQTELKHSKSSNCLLFQLMCREEVPSSRLWKPQSFLDKSRSLPSSPLSFASQPSCHRQFCTC